MRIKLLIALIGLGLLTAACSIDVEVNEDGSLQVMSELKEAHLQESIGFLNDDPNLEELGIEFHDGYLAVDMVGIDENNGFRNEVTFNAELSVVDGHLGVNLYDATWQGEPMPEWMVEIFNENLAKELERQAKDEPDSTLVRVEVTDDTIEMEWRVETDASRQ